MFKCLRAKQVAKSLINEPAKDDSKTMSSCIFVNYSITEDDLIDAKVENDDNSETPQEITGNHATDDGPEEEKETTTFANLNDEIAEEQCNVEIEAIAVLTTKELHAHFSDPPSKDDIELSDAEAPTDAEIDYLFAHISDPPIEENGVKPIISVNTQSMEFAEIETHLYAHHSDPPDDTNDVKIAIEGTTTKGNVKKYMFAHHSDPPEGISNDVNVAVGKATLDGKLKKHLFAHHLDPPLKKVKLYRFLSNLFVVIAMMKRKTIKCSTASSCIYMANYGKKYLGFEDKPFAFKLVAIARTISRNAGQVMGQQVLYYYCHKS